MSGRRFWKGRGGTASELASRLAGSSDLYAHHGRRPSASLNFITAHDGFTLRDLGSYNGKHNEANGEENRDECNDNDSWNCGAEGPTDDPAIHTPRARQLRNFLAPLLYFAGLFIIGWLLGGSKPEVRGVLGLATAGRNFGAALVPAANSFTDPKVTIMIIAGAASPPSRRKIGPKSQSRLPL